MRVSTIFLSCLLSTIDPAMAQVGLDVPDQLGGSSSINLPMSVSTLQRSALHGDRRASAQLAVMLQDATDIENNLVTSALHFQVAIASGCTDLAVLALRAVERLTPEQRAAYEAQLPRWLPATATEPDPRVSGPCLQW